jgi:hypothetical protein
MPAAPPPDIFELIDRVVEMRQADAAQLANLFGGTLHADTQQSNDSYAMWQVTGTAAPVQSADLRFPQKPGRSRLVSLALDTGGNCIGSERVTEKYGQPQSFDVQHPNSPIYYYYAYRLDWGQLAVGFNRQECVASVVFDIKQ